ncbi:MAG: hypothetical protein R3B55_01840 [Candidatus Paceibacterota bacterium]
MFDLQNKWSEMVLPWLLDHGIKIVIVLVLALIVRAISHTFG